MMNKKIIFSFLMAALFIIGCKKDDGFLPKDVIVDRVPQPSVVKNGGSASLDVLNLTNFQGKFDVKLLYASDIPPAKLDVVIIKNGNKSSVKLYKADVTTYPSSFTITAAELAALFGAPIALGDNYDIGVDIYTKDGKKYEAFPAVGAAYGNTGVANQPGFSSTVRYSAICAYDPSIYQGNFTVVSDAFEDFAVGSTVVITQVSATQFSFIQPAAKNPIPMVFTIDAANGITAPTQKIGDNFTWQPAYTNPKISVTASPNSFVAPCDKTLTVVLNYSVDQGSFGGYKLVLKKA
jgi:hypothetical protein